MASSNRPCNLVHRLDHAASGCAKHLHRMNRNHGINSKIVFLCSIFRSTMMCVCSHGSCKQFLRARQRTFCIFMASITAISCPSSTRSPT